jgi:hypothetical protein
MMIGQRGGYAIRDTLKISMRGAKGSSYLLSPNADHHNVSDIVEKGRYLSGLRGWLNESISIVRIHRYCSRDNK